MYIAGSVVDLGPPDNKAGGVWATTVGVLGGGWGAFLMCLCNAGGKELRFGLGERSYSSIIGAVVGGTDPDQQLRPE